MKPSGYIVQVVLASMLYHIGHAARCLKGFKGRKSFTIENKPIPLTVYGGIGVANQIAGILASILLDDVLGYRNVVLVNSSLPGPLTVMELNSYIKKACHTPSKQCFPPALVFPAVWVPVDHRPKTTTNKNLIDLGSDGITGSYGWFVSSTFVSKIWKDKGIPVNHWRSLLLPAVVENLLNAGELESLRELCPGCVLRVFYPKPCNPNHGGEVSLCALLIAQDRGSCSIEMERQITLLDLHVAIAWLNTKPHSFLMAYESRKKPVLFSAFATDRLTISDRFTEIHFPSCSSKLDVHQEFSPPNPHWNCSCSSILEMRKFVWTRLHHEYKDIVDLLAAFHFQQDQLADMIGKVGENNASKTVCDWLIMNKGVWSPWIPTQKITNKTIYIGGMFPSLNGPEAVWSSPGDELGAIMAIERINRDTAVLKDYRLKMPIVGTQCRRELVLNAYITYLNRDPSRKVVGILGPACSKPTMPIASVSRYHNMIVMGYGADDVSLSDRKRYPYYFRTAPSVDEFKFAYLALFDKFKWKHCMTLRGTRYPASTVLSRTEYLTKNGIDVLSRQIPTEEGLDAKTYVSNVKQTGRTIIILNVYPAATRAIMCEAFKQNLHPSRGYVWFVLGWLDQDWWDTDKHNNKTYSPTERVPCSSDDMKILVDQGYFSLSGSFYGDDNQVIAGGGTVSYWKKQYLQRTLEKGVKPSDYASLAHDAVWTYALALDALIKNSSDAVDHIYDDTTSRLFREYIQTTHFFGVSGLVHFRNGDRLSNINIKQNFATSSKLIGHFVPETSQNNVYNGFLFLEEKTIKWASGNVPKDRLLVQAAPSVSCAVESLRNVLGISCVAAGLVAALIAILLIAAFLLVVFWILKGRYSSKYRIIKRRLNQLGLLDAHAACTIFALDAWEISRDMIVLNRKLGEGAFGAVFGGEGLGIVYESTSVSVAVKTLKTDASVEEKFEFLGEADTMKHFSHENIVQLFGVCTTTEPAFIVMELMIHGDLKSFLLARRRLIDRHGTPEAEEVTSSNLTSMALDIARGMQYLSQKKYVHRDLALRNCMVGVGNVIKIGDFGLARQLNIKDYYRFERKGALPIRWMAPEAITEGLFTTQSDVWSFGVTLWELATFGGFPYQGASNQVVLEYVKDGNILEIPQGSSDQMANLLRMCWRFDYLDRPTPYSLVCILTENPEIVSACVEVPPTTVSDDSIGRFYVPSGHGHGRNSRLSRTPSVSSQLSERLRVSGFVKESSLSSKKHAGNSSSGGHSPGARKTSFFFKL